MKTIILNALVVAAYSSASVAEPIAVPAVAKPVVAETAPVPTMTEVKSADVETVVSTAPSFCGQADVFRMTMNTDAGKKLQLQQQEAIRQAIAQLVAEGKIPTQQSLQPTATNSKSAQFSEVPAATPDVEGSQN